MADSTLEITLRCASDLKKVNLVSKMEVYAVFSISGGDKTSIQKFKTPPDHDGGSNPTWDFPITLPVEAAALQQNRLTLDVRLVCERVLGDKDVGEVHVSVKELFDSAADGAGGGRRFVSYQVMKPSGRPKGQLTFSYKFSGRTAFAAEPSPVAKVSGKSVKVHPVAGLKSISVDPLSAKIYEVPTVAYPSVEFKSKSVYLPSAKVSDEPTAAYPAVELKSNAVYPPTPYPAVELKSKLVYPPTATVYEEPSAVHQAVDFRSSSVYPAAYPAVELDSNSMYPRAVYPAVGLDSNTVYPPEMKVYEEPTSAHRAVELESVYTPAEKVREEIPASAYPLIEFNSDLVYPQPDKTHEEPAPAEFLSDSVYPPPKTVYQELTEAAHLVVESKSNSVYPQATTVYGEPTAAYTAVKLDHNSLYPPATAGLYTHAPLHLAVEAAEGSREHDTPPAGWHPTPYIYGYSPPDPFYTYPPQPPPLRYVHPPLYQVLARDLTI